jgi:hypothetical protein
VFVVNIPFFGLEDVWTPWYAGMLSPDAYPKLLLLNKFMYYLMVYEVAGLLPNVILFGELI